MLDLRSLIKDFCHCMLAAPCRSGYIGASATLECDLKRIRLNKLAAVQYQSQHDDKNLVVTSRVRGSCARPQHEASSFKTRG